MFSKSKAQIFVSLLLLAVLSLTLASPARAFDGRGGDTVIIAADEVINDDLYIGARTFTMNGTVNGDLVASGNTLTINGTVDGDVMAAGQTIIVNGAVSGSVRIAGGALLLGENAKIDGDVIAFGASLEMRKGAVNQKDVLFMGGQSLLAGEIGRNLQVFSGSVELRGNVGGNMNVEVGDSDSTSPHPSLYLPEVTISMPTVPPGLTINPESQVGGKLVYTSSKELSLPAGVVVGGIQRIEPVVAPEDIVKTPTLSEQIITGIFDALRRMVTLALFGLLLVWLFPAFIKGASDHLRQSPLPALGWGVVAWGAFFFAILVLVAVTVIAAIIFGVLTLGSITGVVTWMGILGMFVLIFGFILSSSFIAQLVISFLGGKMILSRLQPDLAEHKFWPMLFGVIIFAALAALPFIGWLVNLLGALLGLGALWMFGGALFDQILHNPAR